MLLDMAVLAFLAVRYEYVDYSGQAEHDAEKKRIAEEKAASKQIKNE